MQAKDQQPPELLNELASQQWALWKQSPVSKLVFARYLPDFRFALERETVSAWMSGALSLQQEQEIRGRLLTMHDLENLGLGTIRDFYGLAVVTSEVPPGPARGSSY